MRLWRSGVWLPLAAAAALGGCAVSDLALTAREGFEETRPLDPTGSFSLENVNGRVRIDTWDEAKVRIEGEKAAGSEMSLKAIEVRIEGGGERVSVGTRLPHSWLFGGSGRVDYHVTVPRRARVEVEGVNGRVEVEGTEGRLRASTVNGRLEIRAGGGEVEASTVNGGITAEYRTVGASGRNRFSTTNGRVVLRLPAGAQGELEARTVNGSIRSDFPMDSEGRRRHHLRGRLGEGGPSFEVTTVNGSVRIEKAG